MLPKIPTSMTLQKDYQEYISELKKTQFLGEIRTDYAARLSVATDNSVYQIVPQAVIFPKNCQDIVIALQLCTKEKYQSVKFSPRGGGTGTNGQSLTMGIIIDCSKYMREIIDVDLQENSVRVQPGVILDELNIFLKSMGMQFAPEISPSNRATIGGMINTDACGNGSKIIGRTSDHVIDLTCVLSDGAILHTSQPENYSQYSKTLTALLLQNQELIQEKFINRPRNLNGYNLLKSYSNQLNLNYLFCGSEGTLGVVAEAKLKIQPLPKFKKLVLVKYLSFDDALRSQDMLDLAKPLVVEAIDEKLLNLAREDSMYFKLKDIIDGDIKSGAVNLVEFVANSEEEINQSIDILCREIDKGNHSLGYYIAKDETEIRLLWDLRKKSVGLISKRQQGTRRPVPFIEDTAVPPEKLADYIAEFKAILDNHGLIYGMYGHVDAGCVHVRPALDLQQEQDEKLFRDLSDAVASLVEKFGGVMWGEHGMGLRCSYAEQFFGKELYYLVRQIKTLFDPKNCLNPGKIAVPLESSDKVFGLTGSLRARFDQTIPSDQQNEYTSVMACNGNGACFNYATQDAMCPSYKVTKDRVHSPKGRATLMREWLRLKSVVQNNNQFSQSDNSDFSHQIYDAMNGCLSCKACASQCPLNVDVPEFKAKFLFDYHKRYRRPWRDYLIAMTETMAVAQAVFPRMARWVLRQKIMQYIIKKVFNIVDVPVLSDISLKKELTKRKAPVLKPTETFDKNGVILIQDVFTSFYDTSVVLAVYDFLVRLGLTVYVIELYPNGKPLHVKGFLSRFSQVAQRNATHLKRYAQSGLPMIGIDPSMTLIYRDEYKKLLGGEPLSFEVKLLQEWLVENKSLLTKIKSQPQQKDYYLLSHCTEKTACVASEKQWQDIFACAGLTFHPLAAGCCGMAGSYGHESEHLTNSKDLFAMDWERYLRDNPNAETSILATGYSCRSQVKRLKGVRLQHPIEVMLRN